MSSKSKPSWRPATGIPLIVWSAPLQDLRRSSPCSSRVNGMHYRKITLRGHNAQNMKQFALGFESIAQHDTLDRPWFGEEEMVSSRQRSAWCTVRTGAGQHRRSSRPRPRTWPPRTRTLLLPVASSRSCICTPRQWSNSCLTPRSHAAQRCNSTRGHHQSGSWHREGKMLAQRSVCRRSVTPSITTLDAWPICRTPSSVGRMAQACCRDKSNWRTTTQFEVRNNMAYANQMQFEVF